MSWFHIQSLQKRLILRLSALFLAICLAVTGLLFYKTLQSAQSLSNQWLLQTAQILSLGTSSYGEYVLPAQLQSTEDSFHYVIRESNGRIISASSREMATWSLGRGPATQEPHYFYLNSLQSSSNELYAVDVSINTPSGPVSIAVAGLDESGEALIRAMMEEFLFEIAWFIPVFILTTMIVAATAIRGGLRPLSDAALKLRAVNPDSLSTRLALSELPKEVRPLVAALNDALDRLEKGFARQRDFTANAAHELRTPLAIISSALENMDDNSEAVQLRQDVSRMSRLVAQLLNVARLDSTRLDTTQSVDLCACADELAQSMAPQAIAAECTLALEIVDKSVTVNGDYFAIYDALRNLVENAIQYSPINSEIQILVQTPGTIIVTDQGPGIPAYEYEKVFDRFARGKAAKGQGAGLGLAIVRTTMEAHGGKVEILKQHSNGACIKMVFPEATPNQN